MASPTTVIRRYTNLLLGIFLVFISHHDVVSGNIRWRQWSCDIPTSAVSESLVYTPVSSTSTDFQCAVACAQTSGCLGFVIRAVQPSDRQCALITKTQHIPCMSSCSQGDDGVEVWLHPDQFPDGDTSSQTCPSTFGVTSSILVSSSAVYPASTTSSPEETSTVASLTTSSTLTCLSEDIIEDKHFCHITESASQSEANSICESFGGQLAEFDSFASLMAFGNLGANNPWIGANETSTTGGSKECIHPSSYPTYSWLSGDAFSDLFWYSFVLWSCGLRLSSGRIV